MEKYSAYCRLILCCNSSSSYRSNPLSLSKCGINAPSEEQIVRALEFIGKKEDLQLPSGFVTVASPFGSSVSLSRYNHTFGLPVRLSFFSNPMVPKYSATISSSVP
ncbi:hypothetical protein K1719_005267 [Acacia pycnantha]|nr:hypothetical protein K1719_005267 [Acacia pycnantha]